MRVSQGDRRMGRVLSLSPKVGDKQSVVLFPINSPPPAPPPHIHTHAHTRVCLFSLCTLSGINMRVGLKCLQKPN